MTDNAFPLDSARRLAALALEEDLGRHGDVTTAALISPDQTATVQITARAAGVLAGGPAARCVFDAVDPSVSLVEEIGDGERLAAGQVVARLSGRLSSLLIGERTCLNFLTHLSGVATLTRRFVDAVAGSRAAIYDTRKTLPGWRALQKYAVLAGGGRNHRRGLYDMLLIKDNHLAGWLTGAKERSIAAAVRAARERSLPGLAVEVEVDTLEQLADALGGRPDVVLLDNMTIAELRRAVALRDGVAPQVELEASGGVTLESVAGIAATGVDRISVGALTHSAPALDLAFDWVRP